MKTASTREIDIKQENKINYVRKNEDGSLEITQNSGNIFTVKKEDEDFQAFAIYSIFAGL